MMILKTLPWKRTWIATKTVIGWRVDEPTHRYASLNTGQIPHMHAKRLCDSHRHTAPCSVWGSVWWRLVTYSHKVSFEFGLESKGGLDATRWNLPRMRRLWSPPTAVFLFFCGFWLSAPPSLLILQRDHQKKQKTEAPLWLWSNFSRTDGCDSSHLFLLSKKQTKKQFLEWL